jgi:hypothetical protein
MLDQRQLVLIPSGTTLTAFALPDRAKIPILSGDDRERR